MDILSEIKKRKTAKSFNGKSVKKECLMRILEAGRLAPSAKNRQVWRFIVIESKESKLQLKHACFGDERLISAGSIIAICTTNISYRLPNGQLSHPLDLSFAASQMMIQATHEKLASAIICTFDEKTVKNLLTIPHTMQVVLLIAIGYSDDADSKITNRLPHDRITSFEHW